MPSSFAQYLRGGDGSRAAHGVLSRSVHAQHTLTDDQAGGGSGRPPRQRAGVAPYAQTAWRPVWRRRSYRRNEASRVNPRRRSAQRNVSDAAAHDSGRMTRTMDPFWTSSGASLLDKAAAPLAGGATSALALAASAAKQATLNISTENEAVRLSRRRYSLAIRLDAVLNKMGLSNLGITSRPAWPLSWLLEPSFTSPPAGKKKWLISAARTPRALETPKTRTNPALCDSAGTPSTAGVQSGPTRAGPAVPVPTPRPRRLS